VVAVPVPLTPMPIGVQVIAAPWREDVALRIAYALGAGWRLRRAATHDVRSDMEIDLPEVVAEVRAAFDRYEKALTTNDLGVLNNDLPRRAARRSATAIAENLYGHDAIKAFRGARLPVGLMRVISRTVITTYGRDFAVASTLFRRETVPGRSAARCRPGRAFRKAGA